MVSRKPQKLTVWQARAARARLLARRYRPSGELLRFYAAVAEWQGSVAGRAAAFEDLPEFIPSLLDLVRGSAAGGLARAGEDLERPRWAALLARYWDEGSAESPFAEFFCRALLQVYAAGMAPAEPCPRCEGPPQAGALRPLGEGLALDLLCPLCLRLRSFPRGRCPGCGESADALLPLYSTPEFPHLRLQACEACRGYYCLVDLSSDPQALPEVDEISALPLDLWAKEKGYRKLHPNLAGI